MDHLFPVLLLHENGGSRFLQNIYKYLPDCMVSHTRKQYFLVTAVRMSNLTLVSFGDDHGNDNSYAFPVSGFKQIWCKQYYADNQAFMANPEKQVYPTMNHSYPPKIFIFHCTEVHMKPSHISAPQESANGPSIWVSDDVAAVLQQFRQQPRGFFMKTGTSMPMGYIFNNPNSFT